MRYAVMTFSASLTLFTEYNWASSVSEPDINPGYKWNKPGFNFAVFIFADDLKGFWCISHFCIMFSFLH